MIRRKVDSSGTSVVHFIEVPFAQTAHPQAQALLSDQLRALRACSDLLSEQKAARGEALKRKGKALENQVRMLTHYISGRSTFPASSYFVCTQLV